MSELKCSVCVPQEMRQQGFVPWYPSERDPDCLRGTHGRSL